MSHINVHEAKTHLSRLLEQVERGEDVVIARAGVPVARLVPYREPHEGRTFGRDADLFEVPANFDDPLPPEAEELFEP